MPKKLTLMRHAALRSSLNGCYVGRLNVLLSESGKQPAEYLADRLHLDSKRLPKINLHSGGLATLNLYAEGAVLTGLYND